MKLLFRLFVFLAPFRGRVVLSILLQFLTIGTGIGLMATSAYLIAKAALHPSTILMLWIPIVSVRFFGISRAVFRYTERYVTHDLAFRILANIRVWLYSKMEELSSAFLLKRNSGDLLSALVSDVDTLQNVYLRAFTPPIVACLAAVLAALILLPFGDDLASALLLFYFCAGLGIPLLIHHLGTGISEKLITVRGELSSHIAEQLQGIYETLIYPNGKLQSKQGEKVEALSVLQSRLAWINPLSSGTMVLLSNFAMWVLLWMAIPKVTHHSIQGVYLPVIILTALTSFEAISPFVAAFSYWGQCLQAAKRLFAMADAGNPEQHGSPLPSYPGKEFSLSIRGLSFQYHEEGKAALWNVDLDLPFGKHLAIVGENGAGKSTLANILLGFYKYTEGSIYLGNTELSAISVEQIRQTIALVNQHTYLFNATVMENLRMAKPDATHLEIEQAAKISQIHDVILNLPRGYDTYIGEAGAKLSGGERQRLALARVLLKTAPIVVFDEPTNGLDSITEKKFLDGLRPVIAGISAIFITHRLLGLEKMDEIIVMKHGQIVERGTHHSLLKAGGWYKTMWELQRQMLNSNLA